MRGLPKQRISVSRHEYFVGNVHAMAGVFSWHNAATLLFADRIEALSSGGSDLFYELVKPDPENLEVTVFRRSAGWEPAIVTKEGDVYFESIDFTVSFDELGEKLASIEMTD